MLVKRLALILLIATRTEVLADESLRSSPITRRTFNVLDYGAQGDGLASDTTAINAAAAEAAKAGGGKVLLPPGRYLSGTIRLQSHVTLFLDAGARLIGTTELSQYLQPRPPEFMPEAKWGKWHRALILAENAEDVTIAGPGLIDGNKVFDPTGEERMRGPHTIVFVNCRRFTIRDVTLLDAANYAIFFQVSDQVEICNVTFRGGWDGVHFRGAPGHDCHNVNIVSCRFYTGDDSIAGRYWDRVVISDCVINSSCNGIRLIGPARHLTIHDCLFYGPGTQPHRTSGERRRTNMLSGILLQPGAWESTQGSLEDVLISDITMLHVAAPVDVSLRQGNTAGRIGIERLSATGVYRAAFSLESWAETPIAQVMLRNVTAEFAGGGNADQALQQVKAPGIDSRPLPAWGLYAQKVDRLTLEDVRFTCDQDDLRPVLRADNVKRLDLDNFKFTVIPGVLEPIVVTNVAAVNTRDTAYAPGGPR